ncbi:MAG TPA: zf-HC2 domain-containing protein [Gemmatimonadales bacterium]|nr:zf-HC2 domain-containing protein [Gemmatimonadales bacterium]
MKDRWTDRLSEYLDGELAPNERIALEAHFSECGACRQTLDELRRVVARAQALDDRPPTTDLWPGIARQVGVGAVVSLGARRAQRRLSFTVPQLAAAAVAVALLSGGGAAWLLGRRGTVAAAPSTTAGGSPAPSVANVTDYAGDARYAAQVADLERALERGRGRLDTATVHVIEKNLGIINRAIRDAQSALAADPANAYLNLHLAREMRRKLELLRQAATLAGARS